MSYGNGTYHYITEFLVIFKVKCYGQDKARNTGYHNVVKTTVDKVVLVKWIRMD